MKEEEYDYIIVGAGLAGLALAKSLIVHNLQKKVALIDTRVAYERDHIWSCWNNVDEKLELPFDYSWNKWQVSHKSKTGICQTKRYPYSSIFAESYYKNAIDKIEKTEGFDLFLGETIESEHFSHDGVSVISSSRNLRAKLLFDSRPPKIDPSLLQQDFFGIIVKSDEKIFDPSCVTLMDFAEFKNKVYGFHFFYILPFSENEALVESVFVGFDRLSEEEHRVRITQYLEQRFDLKSFDEVHREHGHIPMHPVRESATHSRHYLIGARAGLVRPSTGYAFAAIHRFSDELARRLKNEQCPDIPGTYTGKAKLLDAVLLSFLKKKAADAPLIFSSLFSVVAPDVLIRFLCDASSPEDDATVFAAMPRKFELGLIMAGLAIPRPK